MLKKNKINPYVVAIGAGFTISITLNPIANASENPFEIRGLGTGYMLADGQEGKCGEGKCGEGKCGSKKTNKEKKKEKKDNEGKCGEGKCGEGKCGSKKS